MWPRSRRYSVERYDALGAAKVHLARVRKRPRHMQGPLSVSKCEELRSSGDCAVGRDIGREQVVEVFTFDHLIGHEVASDLR